MASFVNPLLLGQSAATTGAGRDFLRRPDPAAPADAPGFAQHLAAAQTAAPPATTEAAKAPDKAASQTDLSSARIDRSAAAVEEDSDFSFSDFMDTLNPLQHIPVIGTIYRELTDDTIKPVARIAGDIMYGVLIGSAAFSAVGAIVSGIVEQESGQAPDVMLADALFGSDQQTPPSDAQPAPTMLAQADQAAPPPSASPAAAEGVKTASTPATTKAPFGGVMDVAASQHRPLQAAPQVVAQNADGTYASRIGNVIYTSPAMRNAARVAVQQANQATPQPSAKAVSLNEARNIAALTGAPAALSLPGAEARNNPTLGSLIQNPQMPTDAAKGNKLPPDLVRDMMLMALDKYKSTAGLAPSEMKIGEGGNPIN